MGGGFAAVASQVGAQASVTHADVGMATAVVLLLTEIGGAVGGSIGVLYWPFYLLHTKLRCTAGAIWTNTLPSKLALYLPFLSQTERDALFASVITISAQPRGDATREGVIAGKLQAQ